MARWVTSAETAQRRRRERIQKVEVEEKVEVDEEVEQERNLADRSP